MDIKIITIWGKISDGFLYSNIGKIRPKNLHWYQDKLEGFFKYRPDVNMIIDYLFLTQVLEDNATLTGI